MSSELESNIRDTMDWQWLVDFNVGKTQLVLFVLSNNSVIVIVKMGESVPEKNNLLRCQG